MRPQALDARQTIVLDDDPTGVQAVTNVPVLLAWNPERLARATGAMTPTLHLMTNVRALPPERAEQVTFAAAAAAHEALPEARLVLRGDSTLRGHLLEEYRAVTRAAFPHRPPVLLLVPALPAAGRITRGGVHFLQSLDGECVPLSETEYARDGGFSYHSARLLEWAEERTGGLIPAESGRELPLAMLRSGGGEAVVETISSAADEGSPAACVPDAETVDDLRLIATGVRRAEAAGVPLLVRCAPAFAGILCGTLAEGLVAAPSAGRRGVLVVCGSYVSGTTRQLAHLHESLGVEAIVPDLRALADGAPDAEVRRIAARAAAELKERGLAVISTPRERPPSLTSLGAGERIARGLAAIVAAVDPVPDVVIAKGGITSQVVLEDGLGADEAWVAGPVLPGVALWQVKSRGRRLAYLVFPGNVGGPTHLTDVVRLVRAG